MADRKIRILINNEFSQLSTGFSTYMRYVLPYLYNTGKYEIAELARYVDQNHPLIDQVPWTVYANQPMNQAEKNLFDRDPTNQFGKFRFNQVLLDFKPDIVIAIDDPWMSSPYISNHPFRKMYKHFHMVTCDGEPQKSEWTDEYLKYDRVLTYSLWAKNLLEKQSNGKIKVAAVASPGADINVFKPVDKKEVRKKYGISENAFIINTVMRNQPRKLYPYLFEAFAKFLKLCEEKGRKDIAQNTYLFCHTSYPDVGWDIPGELQRYHIGHKVLFTYLCSHCGHNYISYFNTDICRCKRCGNQTCHMPNTNNGVSRETLAELMGMSDLYVQYSICLTKDQEILTKNGWEKIQNVKTGSLVWTHNGRWKPVTEKMINSVGKRKVYQINVHGDYEYLQCTEEHPILCVKDPRENPSQSLREYLGSLLRDNRDFPENHFVNTSDIKNGDMLVRTIDDTINDIDSIDLQNFASENDIILDSQIKVKKGDTYPRYIEIDNDFCKFIGLFAADGSSTESGAAIKITYCLSESDSPNITKNIFEKISSKQPPIRLYKDRNAADIFLFSSIHKRAFSFWCKSGKDKKLPDWCLFLPKEKQLSILQGLFIGDGCYNETKNISCYTTISETISNQLKTLLERNRIYYNVHIDYRKNLKDNCNRQPQYRFEIPGDVAQGKFVFKRNSTNSLYYENLILKKVKEVKEIEYNGNVFNIEVLDDNTFTTKIGHVHNCEGFGMPINDAKSCGVPTAVVSYSAMTEQAHNGGGIPVEVKTYFRESLQGTNQFRAEPDNDDCAQKFFDFFSASPEERAKLGNEARRCVEEYYNWENVAKIWEKIIDSEDLPDQSLTWYSPPKIVKPTGNIPQGLNNHQFVEYCFRVILQEPISYNDQLFQKCISALDLGYEIVNTPNGMERRPVNREIIFNFILRQLSEKNSAEEYRYKYVNGQMQNTLQFVEV